MPERGTVPAGEIEIEDDRTYLVVAPMYACFTRWCTRHGFSKHKRNVKYVSIGYQLRGYSLSDTTVIYLCNQDWYDLGKHNDPVFNDVLNQAGYLISMGASYLSDTCIENPPSPWEKELARRELEIQRAERITKPPIARETFKGRPVKDIDLPGDEDDRRI